ncbi:MAG: DUF1858 domain-containing protein [Clostridia bacterium]|nr:DUF1858 domain-containing protein [Clostridia bacterium]NCC43058.1 DUF1858 domain-containing protein [Clostridia bacterium]
MIITKETTIDELIKSDERAAAILMQAGMNCIGCASSAGETLEEAAFEHSIDPVLLVRKLNLYLNGQLV